MLNIFNKNALFSVENKACGAFLPPFLTLKKYRDTSEVSLLLLYHICQAL